MIHNIAEVAGFGPVVAITTLPHSFICPGDEVMALVPFWPKRFSVAGSTGISGTVQGVVYKNVSDDVVPNIPIEQLVDPDTIFEQFPGRTYPSKIGKRLRSGLKHHLREKSIVGDVHQGSPATIIQGTGIVMKLNKAFNSSEISMKKLETLLEQHGITWNIDHTIAEEDQYIYVPNKYIVWNSTLMPEIERDLASFDSYPGPGAHVVLANEDLTNFTQAKLIEFQYINQEFQLFLHAPHLNFPYIQMTDPSIYVIHNAGTQWTSIPSINLVRKIFKERFTGMFAANVTRVEEKIQFDGESSYHIIKKQEDDDEEYWPKYFSGRAMVKTPGSEKPFELIHYSNGTEIEIDTNPETLFAKINLEPKETFGLNAFCPKIKMLGYVKENYKGRCYYWQLCTHLMQIMFLHSVTEGRAALFREKSEDEVWAMVSDIDSNEESWRILFDIYRYGFSDKNAYLDHPMTRRFALFYFGYRY